MYFHLLKIPFLAYIYIFFFFSWRCLWFKENCTSLSTQEVQLEAYLPVGKVVYDLKPRSMQCFFFKVVYPFPFVIEMLEVTFKERHSIVVRDVVIYLYETSFHFWQERCRLLSKNAIPLLSGTCHILIQNVISFLTGTWYVTFRERHSIVVRDVVLYLYKTSFHFWQECCRLLPKNVVPLLSGTLSYTYTKPHFISDRNVVGYFQRTSFHCCQGRCRILIQNVISFLTGTL